MRAQSHHPRIDQRGMRSSRLSQQAICTGLSPSPHLIQIIDKSYKRLDVISLHATPACKVMPRLQKHHNRPLFPWRHIFYVLMILAFFTVLRHLSRTRHYATMSSSSSASSVPKTMQGVQISRFGGTEVLQYRTDLLVPVPGPGEVLVKNDFIGVNYVDMCVVGPNLPPPSLSHAAPSPVLSPSSPSSSLF